MRKMRKMNNTFKNKGLSFITGLIDRCGGDLIYSLAYENNMVILCVAAHENLTSKKFNTDSGRILLLISESEYNLDQDELLDDLATRIYEQLLIGENIKNEIE